MPSLSARGRNLTESFNNITLNIKFWKKYNLRESDYVSKYPKAFLNEIVMNEVNYFTIRCSSSKKKVCCLYFQSTSKRRWMEL